MTLITYHIHVDPQTLHATATTSPLTPKFHVGDQVQFESDFPGTVIVCRVSSPFSDLAAETEVEIPANGPTAPYTLIDIRQFPEPFHIACGSYQKAASGSQANPRGKGQFVPWSGGVNTPRPPIGG
jgi:hypothetical protein